MARGLALRELNVIEYLQICCEHARAQVICSAIDPIDHVTEMIVHEPLTVGPGWRVVSGLGHAAI